MFQSLLNTRHCSSYQSKFGKKLLSNRFNPYSIQGIVHLNEPVAVIMAVGEVVSILTQYKALFISKL